MADKEYIKNKMVLQERRHCEKEQKDADANIAAANCV